MRIQLNDGAAAADDLTITLANTPIYPDSPCPGVHPSVYASWARGEWAASDEAAWLTEVAQMRRARAR
jgi:hypothetical protein